MRSVSCSKLERIHVGGLGRGVTQGNLCISASVDEVARSSKLVCDVETSSYVMLLLLLFATTRSVFKSVKVSVVEIAKRTN